MMTASNCVGLFHPALEFRSLLTASANSSACRRTGGSVSTTLNIQESPDLESTRSGAGQMAFATLLFGGSCHPRKSFRLSLPESAQPTEHSLARCGVNPSATEQRHAAAETEVEFAWATSSDRPAIEAMLARCSAKSLSDRFFRPISTAPDGYLDQVLSHDDIYFVFVVRRDDAVIGLAEVHRTAPCPGNWPSLSRTRFNKGASEQLPLDC